MVTKYFVMDGGGVKEEQHGNFVLTTDYELLEQQLQAKDAEIAGLKRRIDQLESREIDVAVLQGDITDLTHANVRLREALKKYGRHGTVEHVCAMMKHSDYHCDCGFAQHALADTEGQKGA